LQGENRTSTHQTAIGYLWQLAEKFLGRHIVRLALEQIEQHHARLVLLMLQSKNPRQVKVRLVEIGCCSNAILETEDRFLGLVRSQINNAEIVQRFRVSRTQLYRALKVLAGAVKKYPQFAASLDLQRGQLIYKKFSNIGVAVDTDRGLLVAVIRDVDRKGIVELSGELAKISEKARAGKLTLDDMSGGVITISNLGGIGGVAFSPIVNGPEVAILGISRGSVEPVWDGSQFQPKLMLPLSLSYDHRVIDGADAARFLRWVCEAFENPFVLAL